MFLSLWKVESTFNFFKVNNRCYHIGAISTHSKERLNAKNGVVTMFVVSELVICVVELVATNWSIVRQFLSFPWTVLFTLERALKLATILEGTTWNLHAAQNEGRSVEWRPSWQSDDRRFLVQLIRQARYWIWVSLYLVRWLSIVIVFFTRIDGTS